jgi:hypothetical protein
MKRTIMASDTLAVHAWQHLDYGAMYGGVSITLPSAPKHHANRLA